MNIFFGESLDDDGWEVAYQSLSGGAQGLGTRHVVFVGACLLVWLYQRLSPMGYNGNLRLSCGGRPGYLPANQEPRVDGWYHEIAGYPRIAEPDEEARAVTRWN